MLCENTVNKLRQEVHSNYALAKKLDIGDIERQCQAVFQTILGLLNSPDAEVSKKAQNFYESFEYFMRIYESGMFSITIDSMNEENLDHMLDRSTEFIEIFHYLYDELPYYWSKTQISDISAIRMYHIDSSLTYDGQTDSYVEDILKYGNHPYIGLCHDLGPQKQVDFVNNSRSRELTNSCIEAIHEAQEEATRQFAKDYGYEK
jgi:hypothetical protein